MSSPTDATTPPWVATCMVVAAAAAITFTRSSGQVRAAAAILICATLAPILLWLAPSRPDDPVGPSY